MEEHLNYELLRDDKFYELSIPSYEQTVDSVYYQIHLKDLVVNREYIKSFRFNELKQFHESLQKLEIELPAFPKTHFWKKTNKSPKMIEERKEILEKFFSIMINDPFARGAKEMKSFIKACKSGQKDNRSFSCRNTTSTTELSRSRSMTKKREEIWPCAIVKVNL